MQANGGTLVRPGLAQRSLHKKKNCDWTDDTTIILPRKPIMQSATNQKKICY